MHLHVRIEGRSNEESSKIVRHATHVPRRPVWIVRLFFVTSNLCLVICKFVRKARARACWASVRRDEFRVAVGGHVMKASKLESDAKSGPGEPKSTNRWQIEPNNVKKCYSRQKSTQNRFLALVLGPRIDFGWIWESNKRGRLWRVSSYEQGIFDGREMRNPNQI